MIEAARLVVFVAVDVLLIWAAGFLVAFEDVFGGWRERVEEAAFVDADLVRLGDDAADGWRVDKAWDRWQPWLVGRRRRALPDGASRWRHRGDVSWTAPPSGGREDRRAYVRVMGRPRPHRDRSTGVLGYGAVLVDGVRLDRVSVLATVARGKVADAWGCPRCSGLWAGGVLAGVLMRAGTFRLPVVVAAVGHVAAWGLARRIDWRRPDS